MRIPTNKECRITSKYGMRIHPISMKNQMHNGIDLVPKDGKYPVEIISPINGTVIEVVSNLPDSHTGNVTTNTRGNYIVVETDTNFKCWFQHLKANSIPFKKGDKVKIDNRLGTMGTTGASTGIHLHYELRTPANVSFNPEPYLGTDMLINGVVEEMITIKEMLVNGKKEKIRRILKTDIVNGVKGETNFISLLQLKDLGLLNVKWDEANKIEIIDKI